MDRQMLCSVRFGRDCKPNRRGPQRRNAMRLMHKEAIAHKPRADTYQLETLVACDIARAAIVQRCGNNAVASAGVRIFRKAGMSRAFCTRKRRGAKLSATLSATCQRHEAGNAFRMIAFWRLTDRHTQKRLNRQLVKMWQADETKSVYKVLTYC
jgi:hypothetical protein